MSEQLYVGAISGTSVDGIDLAVLVVDDDQLQIHATETLPLSDSLRRTLLTLGQPGDNEIDRLGAADAELGTAIGKAINEFLNRHLLASSQITAIGSHGQTVRHRPEAAWPFTLQIGDANRIAEITGITTVADFRRRDMAAGGQGAPLVPPFHQVLLGQKKINQHKTPTTVLNIGGISNVTILNKDKTVLGFDTGPGNGLMDAWIDLHQQQPFDEDGRWAASGSVNMDLLATLLKDPFLKKAPPKSTGREHFNLAWLQQRTPSRVPAEDVQATLVEFTVLTIANALDKYGQDTQRIAVCGGGRLNAYLMSRLGLISGIPVVSVEELGIDGDGLEAAAFAWLAHQTLSNLPGNLPSATGAQGPRILGAIYPCS